MPQACFLFCLQGCGLRNGALVVLGGQSPERAAAAASSCYCWVAAPWQHVHMHGCCPAACACRPAGCQARCAGLPNDTASQPHTAAPAPGPAGLAHSGALPCCRGAWPASPACQHSMPGSCSSFAPLAPGRQSKAVTGGRARLYACVACRRSCTVLISPMPAHATLIWAPCSSSQASQAHKERRQTDMLLDAGGMLLPACQAWADRVHDQGVRTPGLRSAAGATCASAPPTHLAGTPALHPPRR